MANYDFTYNSEVDATSLKPHHPSEDSGVTIGPGYDMKKRSAEEIKADMMAIGIDEDKAKRLAEGANKTGDDASKWVKENQDIEIEEEQQKKLFNDVLTSEYEKRVKSALKKRAETKKDADKSMYDWDKLDDEQKQILFDFEYNPGLSVFPNLMDGVVEKDRKKVEENYKRYVKFTNKEGKKVKLELGRNKRFEENFLNKTPNPAPPAQPAPGGSGSSAANNLAEPPATPAQPALPVNADIPKASIPEIEPSIPGFSIAFPAARLTDFHLCPMVDPIFKPHFGGPITGPGIPNVVIGGLVAATVGDMCTCVGPPDSIVKGSSSVLIGNKMAARFLDNCSHGGVIIQGCWTVLIGDTPSPTTVMGMLGALSGKAFLELCK